MKIVKSFLALVIAIVIVIVSFSAVTDFSLSVAEASQKEGGRTIIVDDDGDGDFTTISEGIGAADPGDTVLVRGGVYYETLNIYQSSITLKGTSDPDGPAIPVIGSTGTSDPIISVPGNSCIIEGFKIMGDKAREAIEVKGNDNIIEKNTVLNSYVGIIIWGSSNIVRENAIGLDTFGIRVYESFNRIEGNNFWGNKECIYTSQAFNLEITGNTFAGYQTAVSINFYYPTESYCKITRNNFLEPDVILSEFFGLEVSSATFFNCLKAEWQGNYWGLPHLIKVIVGRIEHGNTEYKWVNIDWRPALLPNLA